MNQKVLYSLMMLFSSICSSMYMILVGWVLYEISGNAFYSGMLIGVGFIPGLVLNLYFGVMVDRLNRKKVALTGFSVTTFVFGMFFITAHLDVLTVGLIFLFHLILRTSASLTRPAIQALLVQLFSKKDYAKVIGISTSLSEFGWITGASAAGLLLAVINISTLIGIIVLISIFSMISLTLIKGEFKRGNGTKPNQSVLFDLKDGYHYIKHNKIILYLIFIGFVGQLTLHSNAGLLPVYTKSYLGASSEVFGLLESVFSISAILAGLIASWMLVKYKSFVTVHALSLIMFGLVILSFNKSIPLSFLGIFLIGLGTTLLRISTQSLQQMLTDAEYQGRMVSFRMLINQGSVVLGSPLLGFMSEHFGANSGYMTILVPLVIILLFSVVTIKNGVSERRIASVFES